MKSPTPQWIAVGAAPGFSEGRGASGFSTAFFIGVAAFAIACAMSVSAAVLDIKTLSTRADRVSGGDVLL